MITMAGPRLYKIPCLMANHEKPLRMWLPGTVHAVSFRGIHHGARSSFTRQSSLARSMADVFKQGRPPITSVEIFSKRFTHGKFHAQEIQLQISENEKTLTVQGKNGEVQRFNATWLRHNCHCVMCKEPHSGQRTIDPGQIEPIYSIKEAYIEGENLIIRWNEESSCEHTGSIPLSHIRDNTCSQDALDRKFKARVPAVCKGEIPKVSHETIVKSDQGLWRWMEHLNEEGLCLVQGIPEDFPLKKICELIWTLQPTIYGELYTVESTPDPINIAYSSAALCLHMDLVYYESPPGYQFLLCRRFDDCIVGGESVTVDAWYEAEQMRRQYPDEFKILTRTPATFQKIHYERDRPVHMQYTRPHIVLDRFGQITNINWAPPFEGPLCIPEGDVEPYYQAYHKYAEMLENSDSKLEFRLKEGEMLSFNNRRILHGRHAFELGGGQRLLEGCYLNIDEVKSRAMVFSAKFNEGKSVKNVFNQSPI